MALLTNQEEIDALRESGRITAGALQAIIDIVKPGMTTADLDVMAEKYIRQHDAVPAFLHYQGYPASLCVSVNDEVVHGIPSASRKIEDGDVVSLDLGSIYQGMVSDHARTVIVGKANPDLKKLVADTDESLLVGLRVIKNGARVGDIGAAIQGFLEPKGYGVIRQLCGHGVGKAVHEPPEIPNVGKAGTGVVLRTGMIIAVEPMVALGDWHVDTLDDGWTVVTSDGSVAAHSEHTVMVTEHGYEILTPLPHGKHSRP